MNTQTALPYSLSSYDDDPLFQNDDPSFFPGSSGSRCWNAMPALTGILLCGEVDQDLLQAELREPRPARKQVSFFPTR